MSSIEYDRRYVQWGVGVLESYLLSEEATWPVHISQPAGEAPYPLLTLEGLLLAMLRLQSSTRSPEETARDDQLQLELDGIHLRWRVAWEHKATRRYISRLNLWRNFLEEYRDAPETHADRYRYEVRLRVFLDILSDNTGEMDPATPQMLQGLDLLLQAALVRADFIWDGRIKGGFPAERYWYLYGKLPLRLPARAVG